MIPDEFKDVLSNFEIDGTPAGIGMRFLTDYLSGDTYFRTHREGQNLDRARSQFKLAADMERKLVQMRAIVAKY